MDYSIEAGRLAESTGNVILADLFASPSRDAVQVGSSGRSRPSGTIPDPSALDRKKWGVLLAESSDFVTEALAEEEDYRRKDSLAYALSKLTEASALVSCLNEPSKSFFNIIWTYLASPDLQTNNDACTAIVGILRDFAGHPSASEKDVEKYLSSIADTGLEFTWTSS